MSKKLAPWTDEEVAILNENQQRYLWHPFTCGLWEMTRKTTKEDCNGLLTATNDGWICPKCCRYTQNWAHGFMFSRYGDEYEIVMERLI